MFGYVFQIQHMDRGCQFLKLTRHGFPNGIGCPAGMIQARDNCFFRAAAL
ncbi:hypothetical protein D3OALGA1CA_581 [Olavius algarvensis associated proteobacterium Delta 3]|nr:hypothetical protein D3OALGA1CA_581 [Olavius algarvensis associated proteobacterium Delta 3]